MKVAFTTLGCRTNQNDTAEMQTVLEQEGFTVINPDEKADIYVINSCTVTAKSDATSRQAIKKSLAINENAMVVFTGCYSQNQPEEVAALPGLDILLGNANKLEIGHAIKNRLNAMRQEDEFGLPLVHMSDITEQWDFKPIPVAEFQGRTKAFIKVQTGCDEKCSFCTVARARGRSISDSRTNILNNVSHSIKTGFREITLTGINLGTWGADFERQESFSSLVEEILDLQGDFRVRLSSINPMEIEDSLIDLMAKNERLCPHLHIPLQSGSDFILERMRRNYRSADYRRVVELAASKIPDLGLGADIIVGFPGETEQHFEETLRLVEELPFTYLHVFSYSPRKGTESYPFKNDIPKTEKKRRNRLLSEIAQERAIAFRERMVGHEVSVLVESNRHPETGELRGHTEHYIPTTLKGPDDLMNQIVPVTLQSVTGQEAAGCLA
ncbi:MAG: tRNA (N(6)-L-threonylcarbamoyladenosine(37)-C(2))-methylthiotransferase MtaB [Candidatus Nitronauta litoralis]|uniref:Threonylcarbamoyladenosine tRNA methylthiotransferase MtaB n=1 Tax=Candidatus Nitronauta litoralis TaxID=2705533 RepID=A0A7T0BTH2_9BACT|nr:MAG: tRNA (N(6)-L-threonylcarbamoyladenosine(37)-C(2))-methylthiotransferase MtaB [Candidatus Nitronauta litoralis]